MSALSDHYRMDPRYASFKVGPLGESRGYFRIGAGAVGYGRTSTGFVEPRMEGRLYDVGHDVRIEGDDLVLPFDPDEVVDNLRLERYMGSAAVDRGALSSVARTIYYALRPLMPVRLRKQLQRIYLKDRRRLAFPGWPVDRTVETLFERLLALSLHAWGLKRIPFVWFWPRGYGACAIVTHDIETEVGRDFALQLAGIDASFDIRPSFQIVPEERYQVSASFLDSLRRCGCEVNLHGLNHSGNLFQDRSEFLRQAERINQYARAFGASGFRSPVMYRNADWFADLDFSYDMSVPNVGHLEAQRGGCCTVMPYFIGNVLELPLTTTQDYQLFQILRERTISLWKAEIALIREKHGLVSLNVHPDYLISEGPREHYHELLQHIAELRSLRELWCALPGEVDRWWRLRREMRVISENGHYRVVGPSSDRAVVAFARLEGDRISYEIEDCVHRPAAAAAENGVFAQRGW